MQVGSYRDSPTTPGSGEYLARESFDRALGGPPQSLPRTFAYFWWRGDPGGHLFWL